MASTYLSRTIGSTGNRRICTTSIWFKRGSLNTGANEAIYQVGGGYLVSDYDLVIFSSDQLYIQGANSSAVPYYSLATAQKFRDVNAWYHLVYAIDTTQATASDRVKIWINGERVTAFDTETYPSQNFDTQYNLSSNPVKIGDSGNNQYFDGSMTHFAFIDGTAYDASTFGESDANGVWTPKTSPSVTYGTNGFFLKFENSGSMGTDSSGNGNNFTVNGTMTQTLDTPSTVYATFNANKEGRTAAASPQSPTFSQGNTTVNFANTGNWTFATTTLAVNKGKWYAEMKCNTYGTYAYVGLNNVEEFGTINFAYLYRGDNGTLNDVTAYGSTWTTGDILQIAFDADNGTLWYGKNGTWQNSATQSEIENGTTTNAAASGIDMTKSWLFSSAGQNGSIMNLNTGNGYFGTTAVSSAGSNGNGAIFEYDVPSGYYALNTKNLATYG